MFSQVILYAAFIINKLNILVDLHAVNPQQQNFSILLYHLYVFRFEFMYTYKSKFVYKCLYRLFYFNLHLTYQKLILLKTLAVSFGFGFPQFLVSSITVQCIENHSQFPVHLHKRKRLS